MKRILIATAAVLCSGLLNFAFGADVITVALNKAQALYKSGKYSEALEKLSKVPTNSAENRESAGSVEYWTGICKSRLQDYESAARHFQAAAQLGHRPEALDYERGQALFAAQQLKPARDAFRTSAARNYKPLTSAYYQGYISQVLEEPQAAAAFYGTILKHSDDSEKVRQATLFQIAEMQYERAKKLPEGEIQSDALLKQTVPAYQKSVEWDQTSTLADEARSRIREIQGKVAVPRLANGLPIAERSWSAKITQEGQYDSNVVTLADGSVSGVSNAGSYVSRTSASALREFIFDRRWVLTPEATGLFLRHFNRENAQVYQNDGLTATGALRMRHEHLWLDNPAALLLDAELSYSLRDYNQIEILQFYSRTIKVSAGERFRFFKSASTTILGHLSATTHEDPGQSAVEPGIAFHQNFRLNERDSLSLRFEWDYSRARSGENDRKYYKLGGYLSLTDLFWDTDASFALDLTLTDTMSQRSTRGVEKTFAPSVTLSRPLFGRLQAQLSYAFTRNLSLDEENYTYSRHQTGLGLTYRF